MMMTPEHARMFLIHMYALKLNSDYPLNVYIIMRGAECNSDLTPCSYLNMDSLNIFFFCN